MNPLLKFETHIFMNSERPRLSRFLKFVAVLTYSPTLNLRDQFRRERGHISPRSNLATQSGANGKLATNDSEPTSWTMEGLLGKSLGALLSQPKQQDPDEIIQTLCNRLQHSTNLEDRRAAVLGLRGFSRDYQEVCHVAFGCRLTCVDGWKRGIGSAENDD